MIHSEVRFSIIIPTLNEEHYLPRLLLCLQKQTSSAFEVIIVDGMSDDRTAKKAESFRKKFEEKHIPFSVFSVEKRNVSYQRNFGAARGRGEYLIFLDADVQVLPDYIDALHHEIKKKDKDIVCATTWVEADSVDPKDKTVAVLHNAIYEVSHALDIDFVPGYNCIIQKDIFNKIHGFSSRIVMEEDYHLAQKLTKKGYSITILKKPILIISLRRYRNEGHMTVIKKYILATTHFLCKGPITKELFDYQMGGAAFHKKPLSTVEKKQFQKYLSHTKERLKKYLRDIDMLITKTV